MNVLKKRGRPKSENVAEYRFEIRLTKEDKEKLDYIRSVTGKSRTDILRKGLELTHNIAKINPRSLMD